MIARSRREYLRLIKFQAPYLAFPIRVAVPLLANEKFFWRKLFDHNPDFITVTDKIAAKDWVTSKGIDVAVPQTLWVGTDANAIPDTLWAGPMYVKAAHGCQMNIPVLAQPKNRADLIATANGFLEMTHGRRRLEWAYDGVARRLIAERAVLRDQGIIEIKCFTYGDIVEYFLLLRRGPTPTGTRWERTPDGRFEIYQFGTTVSDVADTQPLPDVTALALEKAAEIGAHFDHVRVDFLSNGKDLFLGEITVYHNAGMVFWQGHLLDAPANRRWDLRKSWFLTHPQKGWRATYAAALRRALDAQQGKG